MVRRIFGRLTVVMNDWPHHFFGGCILEGMVAWVNHSRVGVTGDPVHAQHGADGQQDGEDG